jgi:hypothetical protein
LFGHAVTSKLTIFYHAGAIESNGTPFACGRCEDCKGAGEKSMKIYLLMVLIGTLLTAIRFTSAPEQPSKSLSQ